MEIYKIKNEMREMSIFKIVKKKIFKVFFNFIFTLYFVFLMVEKWIKLWFFKSERTQK